MVSGATVTAEFDRMKFPHPPGRLQASNASFIRRDRKLESDDTSVGSGLIFLR